MLDLKLLRANLSTSFVLIANSTSGVKIFRKWERIGKNNFFVFLKCLKNSNTS